MGINLISSFPLGRSCLFEWHLLAPVGYAGCNAWQQSVLHKLHLESVANFTLMHGSLCGLSLIGLICVPTNLPVAQRYVPRRATAAN